LFFGLLYLIPFTADAQNNVPINTVNGEYIKEWLVLGPFFPDDLGKDFLADAGGEKNVNPKEGDTVTTKDGRRLTWKRYRTEEDSTSLIKAVGGHEGATAYAFCILLSDSTGNGAIYLGSDDGAAVFLNGERVYYNPILRSFFLDPAQFGVQLNTGENRCLVKISQGAANWEFAIKAIPSTCAVVKGTVTAENKEPMPQVSVTLYQKGRMLVQTKTDSKGDYQLFIYPVNGRYDVSAISGEKGIWQTDVVLHPEGRRVRLLERFGCLTEQPHMLPFPSKRWKLAINY